MTRRGVAAVLFTIVGLASPAVAQTTPRAPGRTDAGTARGGAAFERLRNNIEQIARSVDTHWGIYIKCLDTSEEIAINADEAMDTMSVIKIPLMVEVFAQVRAGTIKLDEKVTIEQKDQLPGTGVLRSLDAGGSRPHSSPCRRAVGYLLLAHGQQHVVPLGLARPAPKVRFGRGPDKGQSGVVLAHDAGRGQHRHLPHHHHAQRFEQ